MLSFDSLPSRPLKFAETLQPIDLNFGSPSKLPKPKLHKEPIPQVFPPPQYHSRHASTTSLKDFGELSLEPKDVGSDEWMQQEVARCVDEANGKLDIKWVQGGM